MTVKPWHYILAFPLWWGICYAVVRGCVGIVTDLGPQRAAWVLATAFALAPLSIRAMHYLFNQIERAAGNLARKDKGQQQEPDRDIQVDDEGE